jgi:hypothetical protein
MTTTTPPVGGGGKITRAIRHQAAIPRAAPPNILFIRVISRGQTIHRFEQQQEGRLSPTRFQRFKTSTFATS